MEHFIGGSWKSFPGFLGMLQEEKSETWTARKRKERGHQAFTYNILYSFIILVQNRSKLT